jgi:hypothetical protein
MLENIVVELSKRITHLKTLSTKKDNCQTMVLTWQFSGSSD